MGKSKKKSNDKKDKLHKILKQLDKITKKVKKNIYTDSETSEASSSSSPSRDTEPMIVDIPDKENLKEDGKENQQNVQNEDVEQVGEDEDWLKILGEDPSKSRAIEMTIRPELMSRWVHFCRKGLKQEEYDSIMQHYACAKELEPPKQNPQISSTMKEAAISRDKHMLEIQKIATTALTIIGSIISNVYEENGEGMDLHSLLSGLCDTAKLMSEITYKQSVSRKAFIEPGLSKETREILKDTHIDEMLYGNDLADKIKESRAINKLAENLKEPQTSKASTKVPTKSLNTKTSFVRRPFTQMRSTGFKGQQYNRPRVAFRNKQQFVNHRAQSSQRQRSSPNQDRKK